ncbi:uncharacterized protein LOC134541321 [Bacillus rossius redtenbacheri]|uniref:uncharacterized protein LOC134541321 n=1 Tax=Bacillus rossius redtenbacheri TaxID=93214 RepID=UPI002FDDA1CE
MPYVPRRYVLAAVLVVGELLSTVSLGCLSLAVVAMVRPQNSSSSAQAHRSGDVCNLTAGNSSSSGAGNKVLAVRGLSASGGPRTRCTLATCVPSTAEVLGPRCAGSDSQRRP